MKYEKRVRSDGSHYYSFVTSDRKRLTRKQIKNRFGKDILTESEAEDCLQQLRAKFEADKIRVLNRITWEKEFYNFKALLDQYTEAQKKTAPNSWTNGVFYLRHYVLFYFLQEKKLNNIELWPEYYENFREWLMKAKTIKSKKVIAAQSRNHAIKALNTFMKHLVNKGIISVFKKCPDYPEHEMNSRNIDDIILPNEMEAVYKRLLDSKYQIEAIYFRYLYFSGMRFNEGRAISLGDLFQGEIDSELMKKKLENYKMEYLGYIVSDGQFDYVRGDGVVVRAPFKGRKSIEEKYNRIIPVTDKELWNGLVELAAEKHESAGSKKSRDCLLFQEINDSTATKRLQDAFLAENLKWRPWHCLRHSRATWLIGETGDAMLARLWLGHSSPRTLERYNHMYQAITRAAKAQKLTGKKFTLKKM